MSLDVPDRATRGEDPAGSLHPSPGIEPSRRAVLGAALAGVGSLAAAYIAGNALREPALLSESGSFSTPHWPGRRVSWTVLRPETPRALVVALHGMGGHAADWFAGHDLAQALRGTGLAVAAVDGAASYWHARAVGPYAGSDTGAMVIEDFLPMLAARGLPTDRIGLLGSSMGGYGSLLLASRLGPSRVYGVATLAAALRTSPAGTYPERFDDPADYAAHDVFARTAVLARIPVFLACGDRDRFRPGNEAFARALPGATTLFDAGDHAPSWFQPHLAPAVRFLAGHAPAA